ncbi:hypothetical protein GCM10023093_30990 [Nemorincola caseinilytica]|uniref:T9SS type A sorting domain-containing protein n=2 Tax=Nemorincola caseinilytica TaxID=2054315 RepID=A0ABP8NS86_9BACT
MEERATVAVPDTTCGLIRFYIDKQWAPELYVRTDYGDGTYDSVLTMTGSLGEFVQHQYTAPGNYHITHKLYYDNIFQDSLSRDEVVYSCDVLPIRLYMVADADCEMNGSEQYNAVPLNVAVDSNGVPIDTISATSGINYQGHGPTGTVFGFMVIPDSRYVSCPAGGVIYDTLDPARSVRTKYFGLSCGSGGVPDLAVNMVVPVTGRMDQWGHIYVRNNNCALTDATVKLRYSHKYSAPPSWITYPSAISFPTLTWNLPGMSSGTTSRELYYASWATMSTMLDVGDTVTEEVIVTSSTGTELVMYNNIIERIDTVKASCDPNYIAVDPPACFDTDTQFQFTVHFENTGDDTAHNVYVLDTLSEFLDSHTLQLVMSSAKEMNVTPYTEGGYNIVKFDFPKIKLLDSSWHGLNDGAFIYNIRSRSGLPAGTVIKSRVGIYFDYNDAVMTNTTENLKGCPVTTKVSAAAAIVPTLYPNPATNELYVTTADGMYSSFAIANGLGQKVLQQDIAKATTRVSVSALPAGIYYITFKGANGTCTQRFTKW